MTQSLPFMKPSPLILMLLLFAVGSHSISYAQSSTSLTPAPAELTHAVSLDLGGSAPVIGISYHQQLVRLTAPQAYYRASLDVAVGVGYIPRFCLFTCNTGGPSTHHALLLRWGRRVQGEVGYAGLLTVKNAIAQQAYLPGAMAGLRLTVPHWFFRAYMAGLFHHDDETLLIPTNELVQQRTNYLALFAGISISKRF